MNFPALNFFYLAPIYPIPCMQLFVCISSEHCGRIFFIFLMWTYFNSSTYSTSNRHCWRNGDQRRTTNQETVHWNSWKSGGVCRNRSKKSVSWDLLNQMLIFFILFFVLPQNKELMQCRFFFIVVTCNMNVPPHVCWWLEMEQFFHHDARSYVNGYFTSWETSFHYVCFEIFLSVPY